MEKAWKMTTKTKMLSMLRAFSMRYPVVNSSPRSEPKRHHTSAAKPKASATHTALHTAASRRPTACAFR